MSVEGGPLRTCVGCRATVPAGELLRVVACDGAVVPDPRRRLPGRGAHLHRDPGCLALAERRRAFPRALGVPAPLDLSAVRSFAGLPTSSQRSQDVPGSRGKSAETLTR